MLQIEQPRTVHHLGFADGHLLELEQRRQLANLIPKIPKSKITEAPWFLDPSSPNSLLFDVSKSDAWLEALTDAEHVTDCYVVTRDWKQFVFIKKNVLETVEPIEVAKEEERESSHGFSANLRYFRLNFLDPTEVAMGRQFAAILPILWMMSGAKGSVPAPPSLQCSWLIPDDSPFAVLLRENRFRDFVLKIKDRQDLNHVFLVTNSTAAFHDMSQHFPKRIRPVQLYRNYLENFKINTDRFR